MLCGVISARNLLSCVPPARSRGTPPPLVRSTGWTLGTEIEQVPAFVKIKRKAYAECITWARQRQMSELAPQRGARPPGRVRSQKREPTAADFANGPTNGKDEDFVVPPDIDARRLRLRLAKVVMAAQDCQNRGALWMHVFSRFGGREDERHLVRNVHRACSEDGSSGGLPPVGILVVGFAGRAAAGGIAALGTRTTELSARA